MNIPLIKADLPDFESVEPAFREILSNGKITNFGKYVNEFEAAAAAFLGTEVASVSSGTMGLIFTLQALGITAGTKVVIPSHTFVATAQAVLYAGGTPIFCEINEDMNLDPTDLREVLAKHTDVVAVIPVHAYGLACDADAIEAVVAEASKKSGRSIRILYDAAHGFGASRDGWRVGTRGDAEVFSLSVTKTLVTVEGGLISSKNPDLIRRVKKMRNYGIEDNYNAHWAGLNGKMSEFHAIIGIENLKRIPNILAARTKNATYFRKRIESETPFKAVPGAPNAVHTYKDFTIFVPQAMKSRRAAIMMELKELGVETRAYFFPPIHEQKFFAHLTNRPLPKTEDFTRRVITLPFFTTMTNAEMDFVVDALKKVGRTS